MPAAYSPSSAKKMTACVLRNHCGMRIVQQEEDARRLGPRKFGLFTSWSDEVRISCNDGSLLSRLVEAGITIITLPIDCTAETKTVILRPHVDIEPQNDLQLRISRSDILPIRSAIRLDLNPIRTIHEERTW